LGGGNTGRKLLSLDPIIFRDESAAIYEHALKL